MIKSPHYALVFLALAFAMLAPDDCGSYRDIGYDDFRPLTPAEIAKLGDPALQAAGASDDAIKREAEARSLQVSAGSSENYAKGNVIDLRGIDRAIGLRPLSVQLRLQKAVLLIASGRDQDATVAKGQGRYIVDLYGQDDDAYKDHYAFALDDAYRAAPSGSDASKRIAAEICRQDPKVINPVRRGITC